NVTVACAVRDGLAFSVASIIIDCCAETVSGAVYRPLSSIDPAVAGSSGITRQVTSTGVSFSSTASKSFGRPGPSVATFGSTLIFPSLPLPVPPGPGGAELISCGASASFLSCYGALFLDNCTVQPLHPFRCHMMYNEA